MNDQVNGLPVGWIEVTIDKVLLALDDGKLLHHGWSPQCESFPSQSDEQWGVLKTTAVQDGAFLPEHNKLLPPPLLPRPNLEVIAGDVLMTCAGPRARCGVPCLVRSTRPRLMLSGKMYRFRANDKVMLGRYLEAYLRSQRAQVAIDAMKTGISDSGVNLTHGRFKKLKIPVAPLREQERMLTMVDELFSDLDAGVAALERVKAKLKHYRASVLKAAVEGRLTESWRARHRPQETGEQFLHRILKERRRTWEEAQLAAFATAGKQPPKNWRARYVQPVSPDPAKLPGLPHGWCWASIGQLLAEPTCNGVSFKGTNDPPGTPSLRLSAMTDCGFDYSQRRYITIPSHLAKDLAIRPGDFFVSRGNGSLRLVGRGTLAQGPNELVVFPDTMIRVRLLGAPLLPAFIAAIWPSRFIRSQVERKARTTAGIYKISQQDVQRFAVPVPSREEQQQIVDFASEGVSEAAAAENIIQRGLERAARLRQSILRQAFEGKLVAQDPADEPAAALLARIQQSRAATPAIRTKGKQPNDEFLRRAAIVSYTVNRLASQPSFGRTQLEKTLHLAQSHLDIDLGLEFERYAAGPFDKSIYRLEGVAKRSGWFSKQDRRRFGVNYHPGPKIDAMCQHAARLLGDKRADFDRLLDHIAAMNTDDAELFATAYAAWNDLLIDGRPAGDQSIITEIHGWHESKKRFTPPTIRKRIQWMRLNGYVPMGSGTKTGAKKNAKATSTRAS